MKANSPDTLDEALATARAARDRSYARYSDFNMGAAVVTDSGACIPGALVENISFGLSMCAERAAMFAAVAQGAGKPRLLVLNSARTGDELTWPCGACLQVALELGGPELVVVACDPDGRHEQASVRDLAPRQPYKP